MHKIADEEHKESLDDLRKKRLAYFQSQTGSIGNYSEKEHHATSLENTSANKNTDRNILNGEVSHEIELNSKEAPSSKSFTGPNVNKLFRHSTLHDKSFSHVHIPERTTDIFNSKYEFNNSKDVYADTFSDNDSVPAFSTKNGNNSEYVCEGLVEDAVNDNVGSIKTDKTHELNSVSPNELDGYDETVERLIRATKEELLGLKTNDDIWQRIYKTSEPCVSKESERNGTDSNVTADYFQNNEKSFLSNTSKEGIVHGTDHVINNRLTGSISCQYQQGTNNEFRRYENTTPSADEIVTGIGKIEALPTKSTESYELEPPTTKQISKNEVSGPSDNLVTVEAIFGTRQENRSQRFNAHMNLQESIDLDHEMPENINAQHIDLSGLGLSTHRPRNDSYTESVQASDLNLGDTVTVELRTVLGEDKFQQFLEKAKREIDDLHENGSDRSGRKDKTPRLIRENAANSTQQKSFNHIKKHVGKEKTPERSKERGEKGQSYSNTKDVFISDKGQPAKGVVSDQQSIPSYTPKKFTSRFTDAEIVLDATESCVLNPHDLHRSNTTSTLLKPETNADLPEKEKGIALGRTVPELNLSAINKSDSPRPKLNRPKHEPFNFYQDKTKAVLTKNTEKDCVKQNPAFNYEQVPVTKSIAFSADEIYSQAYGSPHPKGLEFQIMTSVKTSGFQDIVHSSIPGQQSVSVFRPTQVPPHTPTTPHSPQSHVTQSLMVGQSDFQGKHTNEKTNTQHYAINVLKEPHYSTVDMQVSNSYTKPSHYTQIPASSSTTDHLGFRGYPSSTGSPFTNTLSMNNIPHPPTISENVNPMFQTLAPNFYQQQGIPMSTSGDAFILMAPHPPEQHKGSQPTDYNKRRKSTPETPITSNAEVQTETLKLADFDIEESAFTSVSQLPDADIKVPHPPQLKKSNRPTPRKQVRVHDSKRHIDGIRQHHEQRRQEQEDSKLTDEEILMRQRRFAKASLERYFTSLENLYLSPKNLRHSDLIDMSISSHDVLRQSSDHTIHDESCNGDHSEVGETGRETSIGRDVVIDKTVKTDSMSQNEVSGNSCNNTDDVGNLEDGGTVVNSEVTGVSFNAGGVTERLEKMGVQVLHNNDKNIQSNKDAKENVSKKHSKQGKRLLICPECDGLNKEYMSWCTHCGEMIIGVEPKLISKTRDGKLRIRPVPEKKEEIYTMLHHEIIGINSDDINYIQETSTKPFSLNLEDLKSEDCQALADDKNTSPIKSDGKDSGRPSSDDRENDTHGHMEDVENTDNFDAMPNQEYDTDSKQLEHVDGQLIPEKLSQSAIDLCSTEILRTDHEHKGDNSVISENQHPPDQVHCNMSGLQDTQEITSANVKTNFSDNEFDCNRQRTEKCDKAQEILHSDNIEIPQKGAVAVDKDSLHKIAKLDMLPTPQESVFKEYIDVAEKLKRIESGKEIKLRQGVQDRPAQHNTRLSKGDLEMDSIGATYLKMSKKHDLLKSDTENITNEKTTYTKTSAMIKEEITSVFELTAEKSQDVEKSEFQTLFISSSKNLLFRQECDAVKDHNNSGFLKSDSIIEHKSELEKCDIQRLNSIQISKASTVDNDGKSSIKNSSGLSLLEAEEKKLIQNPAMLSPPLPGLSSNIPINHNELALKLPANSMEFSADYSEIGSQNFNALDDESKTEEQKKSIKEEKRNDRRRRRGHGALDVEVFGIEEMRESRNSSRGQRLVPILNLAGNSSDEDDFSIQSDDKQNGYMEPAISLDTTVSAWEPVQKELDDDASLFNDIPEISTSPDVLYRCNNMDLPDEQSRNETATDKGESWEALFHPEERNEAEEVNEDRDDSMSVDLNQPFLESVLQQDLQQNKSESKGKGAKVKARKSKVRQSWEEPGYRRKWARSSTAWSSHNTGELNTSASLRSSAEKQRPSSAPKYRRPVSRGRDSNGRDTSPLRQSVDKLKRPSSANIGKRFSGSTSDLSEPFEAPTDSLYSNDSRTGVSPYHQNIPRGHGQNGSLSVIGDRDKSGGSIEFGPNYSNDTRKLWNSENHRDSSIEESPRSKLTQNVDRSDNRVIKPLSLFKQQQQQEYGSRKTPACSQKSKMKHGKHKHKTRTDNHGNNVVVDFFTTEHRLPKSEVLERLSALQLYIMQFFCNTLEETAAERIVRKEKTLILHAVLTLYPSALFVMTPRTMAVENMVRKGKDAELHCTSPKSTYDKYLEMTPRIEAGTISKWQCLPDEILLHVFAYLDQTSLTKCAQVCHQFYRVAMDESLWRYITIKKQNDLDDNCLMEISKRHPISLALIQCQGEQVTAKGLRDLFRQCAPTLKELNISLCSGGALHGDSVLLHAAARCDQLTHIDTSWCNVTDSGLMAISNTVNRLESLCMNGCQAISDDGLETMIRKHGANLRVLEMYGCFNISPRGLRCIANNCINLLSINLGNCYKLTDSSIAQLSASLGRVENLDLRGCKQIKDNSIRKVVKNCPRLKQLSLANCPNITDVSLLEISTYLTDIRSIDLCGCKKVTDSSIRALVNTCTNLREIDISSTGCTHRSISMIANFSSQRLETLKINFLSDVTEQSLIKLAKHCRKLKVVHMYGCPAVRNTTKLHEEHPTFTMNM